MWWLYHWPTQTLDNPLGPYSGFREAQAGKKEYLHEFYWVIAVYSETSIVCYELTGDGHQVKGFYL